MRSADAPPRLNDFVIKLANVNGTGSASANTLLMKSIFRMGIPVMGKNYSPRTFRGCPPGMKSASRAMDMQRVQGVSISWSR